jgi:hypothetical protein
MSKTEVKKIFCIAVVISLLLPACSRDRLTPLKDNNEGNPVTKPEEEKKNEEVIFTGVKDLSSLFEKWAVPAKKVTVNSNDDFPIVGEKGSLLYMHSFELLIDGKEITYPFEVEFLEVYTPREMILNLAPTMAGDRVLASGGEFFIRVTKDGKEASLSKDAYFTRITTNGSRSDDGFSYFSGKRGEGGMVNWTAEPEFRTVILTCRRDIEIPSCGNDEQIRDFFQEWQEEKGELGSVKRYSLFPDNLGWINIDKYISYDGEWVNMSIYSGDLPQDSYFIFIYIPSINSMMRANGKDKFPLPVGLEVKAIAFATTTEGVLYAGHDEFTVSKNRPEVDIPLKKTELSEWLRYLDTL